MPRQRFVMSVNNPVAGTGAGKRMDDRQHADTHQLTLIHHRRNHILWPPNTLIKLIPMQLVLHLPLDPLCRRTRRTTVHVDEILFETRREDSAEVDEVFGSQCDGVCGGYSGRSNVL